MTWLFIKKTFIKNSKEAINKIDDSLSFVEYGIDDLYYSFRNLTQGNTQNLAELSKTNVSDYQDKLDRMSILLSDMYSLKNDLLDDLELMKEKN